MASSSETHFGARTPLRRLGALATLVVFLATLFVTPPKLEAAYGRTEGGYAGGMLGAVGGAALGTAIIGAAGIASPLIAGTLVVASSLGTGFVGARVGSRLGSKVDDEFDPKNVWMVVGGLTGALAGLALGPAGSIVGKVVGAGVGAVLGGVLGRWVANDADQDFNPRTVGGLIGGLNGLMIGGPIGAVAGTTLGYVGGKVLDKHIFWNEDDDDDRDRRSDDDEDDDEDAGPYDRYSDAYLDDDGDYIGGYDRGGFDRMGYDEDGYDREGFDRDGFDRDGVDRNGFDQDGFQVRESNQARDPDKPESFDKDLYNAYWYWYAKHGGRYPDFVDSHWDFFPESASRRQRIQHTAYYHAKIREALDSGDEDIRDIRKDWTKAVKELQRLVERGASQADREEALEEIHELEKKLRNAVKRQIEDEGFVAEWDEED